MDHHDKNGSFMRKLALSTAMSFALAAGAVAPTQAYAQQATTVDAAGQASAKKTPLTPEERQALHEKMRAQRQAAHAGERQQQDDETAQCITLETGMVKKGDSVKNHLKEYPQCARFFPPGK